MGASCTKAGREEAAFLKAAKEGDCHIVQQAITQDVEWAYKVQTWNGQSVFHLAGRYGKLDVLETAVEAVRFNPAGPQKWSKLLRMGHSTDAILRAFANLQDARCQTPLHLASIYGHADVAQRLLELGSTPWSWDELGGRTPLHYAASMGHVDVIRVIISHNAPAPVGEALRRPNNSRTKLVDICNDSGYTPLHYAVWAGNTAAIRALTSYDASLSARNVACGSDWIVSCLKCTPLHLAAHKGNEAVVKLLLSAYVQCQPPAGSDAPPVTDRRRRDPRRHVNANRQLPYHMAVVRNHTRLAEMLHPDVPFSFILTPEEMESRMYGVVKLAVLASKVLQVKLLMDIDAAVAAMALKGAAGAAGGGGGIGARARSGSVAALSGAVAAAAVAGQTGGAAAAHQVLAAATARLRAAGELSFGGAGSVGAAMDAAGAATVGPSADRKLSFDVARPGGAGPTFPSRFSHDSAASAPPAVAANATAAGMAVGAATAAAVTTAVSVGASAEAPGGVPGGCKTPDPPSGGSSSTSAGDPEREPLAVEPVQDITNRPRPSDAAPGQPALPPPDGQGQQPLPLPPAPISPFLPAATAGTAGTTTGTGGASRPPAFNDTASAFALFAAEPFDDQPNASGGAGAALQPTGSNSVSLAALAHNRAQQAAAATGPSTQVTSTSVSIALQARNRIMGAAGGGAAAGSTTSTRNGPGRNRSLRKLLAGSRARRPNTLGANQQQRSEAANGDQSGPDGDSGDDLDDILYSMRPNEGEEPRPEQGAAAAASTSAAPGVEEGAARAAGAAASRLPAAPTVPSAAPLAQQQQHQQKQKQRGGLSFWRRTTSHGLGTAGALQTATSESGSPYTASVHAGVAAGAALAAVPAGGARVATPLPLGASGQMSTAPSGPLPPGVVEAAASVEQPLPPHTAIQGAAAAPADAAGEADAAGDADAGIDAAGSSDAAANVTEAESSKPAGGDRRGLQRRSVSLAVLARGSETAATAAGDPGADKAGEVDGAVLAMLASLVEAPQHVLRRYRLLQLTHGVDLQDLLRDHSDQVTAAGGVGPAVGPGRCESTPVKGLSDAVAVEAAGPVAAAAAAAAASTGTTESVGAGAGAGTKSRGIGRAATTAADDVLIPGGVDPIGITACDSSSPSNAPASPALATAAAAAVGSPFAAYSSEAIVTAAGTAATLSSQLGQANSSGVPPPLSPGLNAAHGSAACTANLAGQLLRTLSSQAASESGDGMCGVCFDQPDCLRVIGCGHRLCADCSRELCKLNSFKPALCPFCRGMIGGFKYAAR